MFQSRRYRLDRLRGCSSRSRLEGCRTIPIRRRGIDACHRSGLRNRQRAGSNLARRQRNSRLGSRARRASQCLRARRNLRRVEREFRHRCLELRHARISFPHAGTHHRSDGSGGVSNLPTDLESASRYLGGAGKQKDGKRLIKLFCIEGANPHEYPAEWERFLAYARQDIEAMREVYRRTRPLPSEEWRQYWAFEHINRRGVTLDMPYVRHAAALAVQDAGAIGRRLAGLTGGAVTPVTQAQRIATWLHDNLADAAMREILTVGVPADDDDDDDDVEADPQELSLERDRVARVLAMLDAKRANGGLSPDETRAHEAATLRLYGAGASPKKFARLEAQQVDGVLRGQYRFAGAGQTGRMTSRGAQIQNLTRDVLGDDGVAESPLVEAIAKGCNYATLAAADPA